MLTFSSLAVLFSANVHWTENAHICVCQTDLHLWLLQCALQSLHVLKTALKLSTDFRYNEFTEWFTLAYFSSNACFTEPYRIAELVFSCSNSLCLSPMSVLGGTHLQISDGYFKAQLILAQFSRVFSKDVVMCTLKLTIMSLSPERQAGERQWDQKGLIFWCPGTDSMTAGRKSSLLGFQQNNILFAFFNMECIRELLAEVHVSMVQLANPQFCKKKRDH